MRKISYKFSCWLLYNSYIVESDVGKICFAIEVVLSNALSFGSIIVTGLILKEGPYTLLFLLIFIFFRTLRDRYHANKFYICFFLTVGTFVTCLVIKNSKFLHRDIINILFLICNIFSFLYLNLTNVDSIISGEFFDDFFTISFIVLILLSIIAKLFHLSELSLFLLTLGLIISISSVSE